jgi:transcription elongation factor Elf1
MGDPPHGPHPEKTLPCAPRPSAVRGIGIAKKLIRRKDAAVDRPYQCDRCQRTFEKKRKLAVHMDFHQGIYSFQCDLCDEAFRTKRKMKTHRNTHTREKTFPCEMCSATFLKRLRLQKHCSRVHAK